jgi:alpha-tubulin suppressor-like RCC1 family protein
MKATNSSGTVLFQKLKAGEHTVTLLEIPDGLTVTSPQPLQISVAQAHNLVFAGVFPPAQVTGTAKSWGKTVGGVLVRVEGKDTVEVTTSSDGMFQVDSIRRGNYTLTVRNYTGVRFKDTTLTQTLQSGANSAEFIGKPDPEPTWASVNADGSGTNSNAGSACGLTIAGEVYCWGANYNGQLGDDTTIDRHQPTIVNGSHSWASVTAGRYHTCGLTEAGEGYCWGANNFGQLGNGRPGIQHTSPALISGGHTWASVTAGYDHTCGMTTAGKAYCWGYNGYGALGDGGLISQSTPTVVKGGHAWESIDVGGSHSCGVTTAGEVYCWGSNNFGQLGNGRSDTSTAPVLVSGGYMWTSITGGYYHACGLTTAGEAYCWGYNTSGQLGDGTTTTRRQPILVGGEHTWLSLSGGYYHSCGVTTAEEVYCWGRNKYGGLGDGTFTSRSTPNPVSGGYNWTLVDAAGSSSCGAAKSGGLYCWGRNDYGGLGDGTTTNSTAPVRVGGNW